MVFLWFPLGISSSSAFPSLDIWSYPRRQLLIKSLMDFTLQLPEVPELQATGGWWDFSSWWHGDDLGYLGYSGLIPRLWDFQPPVFFCFVSMCSIEPSNILCNHVGPSMTVFWVVFFLQPANLSWEGSSFLDFFQFSILDSAFVFLFLASLKYIQLHFNETTLSFELDPFAEEKHEIVFFPCQNRTSLKITLESILTLRSTNLKRSQSCF